ncbi:MAG: glutamate--tRNA ligase [Coriobacteriales bacterium]|jgi:glutamyl-tRNA synthetase|nr:glutamate--tRNA ligase [Coriobacteriales bacterium]
MDDTPVRVRFAPSPTGYLHIGGARTAIYNWAYAKNQGGSFILRIEDTDRQRSLPEHTAQILRSLRWLGLDWDEGPDVGGAFGPYLQSQQRLVYDQALTKLRQNDSVYPCFCTSAELKAKREAALAARTYTGYDRTCRFVDADEAARRIAAGEAHTWRIKLPLDRDAVAFDDLVFGHIKVGLEQLDDFILVRADGSPTYNFAVSVDDSHMRISHVIRGDDHLSNTPKQILVFEALESKVPAFAHLSMILGNDGKRLSKRHGATSLEFYRDTGVLPEALLNYLALLGWSLDGQTTLFDAECLKSAFSLQRVSKNPAIFDTEKLLWVNQAYLKRLSPQAFLDVWQPYLLEAGLLRGKTSVAQALALHNNAEESAVCPASKPIQEAVQADIEANREWYLQIPPLVVERVKLLAEVNGICAYLFCGDEVPFDERSIQKCLKPEGTTQLLNAAIDCLDTAEVPWRLEAIEQALRHLPQTLDVKPKLLFQAIRVALCGTMISPPLFESLILVGREFTLNRLRRAAAIAG